MSSDRGRSIPASRDAEAAIDVPDIRDYQRINAELVRLLDEGFGLVRLRGVENQRLLVAGIAGSWSAVIEVEGNAGPELAAGLDAPGLRVVCLESAADGAGSSLRNGGLLILGDAGACVGYAQRGGRIIVAGAAGERAGLNQAGGTLTLLGPVGQLAGERQRGGSILASDHLLGSHQERGRLGGQFVRLPDQPSGEVARMLEEELRPYRSWLDPERFAESPVAAILERLSPS